MKSFTALLLACVVAISAAFAPSSVAKPAFKSALSMAKDVKTAPNAAALAAFATAIAPLAANAEELDTSAVAGFGVGLVACVVFFAVGFSVGYGTLVKP
eukprot:CAMPEP_0116049882 /NCGR_PEP_ID=MMETSP0322-20121206/60_1 /TAXON_ID=163516 /ORGANISM="Leptocylindrus danicus var. apora, Strain B651" /LENGTH=98 /DNA_ID=CAMNT_0003532347 /DNA_START=73 /DNA_END=369 /DNA_ORIENTATION=+